MGCAVTLLIWLCIIVICIVAAKWLLGYAQITIPQPLLVIIGIILFMVTVLFLLNCAGLMGSGPTFRLWR